ncbi:MAG: tRNA (guanosine(37)-N1)-methyltransferase TrmD [Candidatus Gastranaerophilales bacterium]|nr:tRNA (guanosine(37)-N1)-methyltransferase TrmD [Candidatus Gastranaerophilales bacterium]MCM1073696.1 tRNA (guanosine(37)-N1)-methyltransferase TrmD [Bacteroides sp.]
MRFDVLTLFPELIQSHMDFSIMKRASEDGIISVNTINPRDYTLDKHKKVDDTPYGGGAGMVLMPQPYVDAYEGVNKLENSITLMMTPQGEPFTDKISNELAKYDQIVILCGHYEGYDERIREIIQPREISIGDFVLTGGELPALCVIDSVSRKIEGTLGKIESAHDDSFSDGLLEYPQYTKPREYRGLCVPEVLLNGNHKLIDKYRMEEKIRRTKEKRPDLWEKYNK